MKAILMSIQPKWLEKILNGKKTLEIRKSIPKDFKGWCYLYCTKGDKNNNLIKYNDKLNYEIVKRWQTIDVYGYKNGVMCGQDLNGKIVARFWFDEFTEFDDSYYYQQKMTFGYHRDYQIMLEKSCLSNEELFDYCRGKGFYAWHIKNLEIFDKPKELNEFYKWVRRTIYSGMDCPPYVDDVLLQLTKAPQSWMYVEVNK